MIIDQDPSVPTAIVTGGTRGIGAAIAEVLETMGIDLILTGTNPETIKALNNQSCDTRQYLAVDFTNPESTDAFINTIACLNRLDICINNAGINIIKSAHEATPEQLQRITDVNLRAPFLISQAAASVMKKNRYGRIINIASIWSIITKRGRSPGFVLTDLTKQSLTQKEIDQLAKQVPCGRMAEPAEIAKVVAFLASPDNTYLTGQNIVVDGGFSHV
jgi:3-oxoacyl-[acyl-carrier protein] reductase